MSANRIERESEVPSSDMQGVAAIACGIALAILYMGAVGAIFSLLEPFHPEIVLASAIGLAAFGAVVSRSRSAKIAVVMFAGFTLPLACYAMGWTGIFWLFTVWFLATCAGMFARTLIGSVGYLSQKLTRNFFSW